MHGRKHERVDPCMINEDKKVLSHSFSLSLSLVMYNTFMIQHISTSSSA